MLVTLQERDREKGLNRIMKCVCGEHLEVYSSGDVNCPKCDRWFNFVGQELRPPCEWGEETGERFDDFGNYIGGGDY